ncbi:hypothetical protein ASF62_10955 [Leifsonia sp. Leaf325]|nr:hypothetical protein [Leifsonia sp. Leaf325]KQQ94580.1 hypothetical protein ASF62_10955 [Leifsonia sp. Leaf325]
MGDRVIRELSDALKDAVQGDASAVSDIVGASHASLKEAAHAIGTPLVVRRASVIRILQELLNGRTSPSAVQAWASLMRRGYVARAAEGPIESIDIDYDQQWEDGIAMVISRLDEIGDVVDGEIDNAEAHELLQSLGAQ